VLTHGNGPQVGNELLRHELGAAEAPPLPLWVAVGQTQAEVGALAAAELPAVAGRPAAVLLTRVSVAADDPAFANPTKPVGPFYSEEQARELERERGWALVEDAGRGWRRVVASPRPLEILELESIRALLASGAVTVAVGGGGIPVVQRDGRVDGVDAVIDKDLLILTQVASVFRGFGTPDEEAVAELRPDRDEGILAELPAGSMRPKVEASFAFVRATGGRARITSAEAFAENSEAGTVVVPASAP
jgi:carbamate kinase